MTEEWRGITSYEDTYQVSDLGRVRRLAGVVTRVSRGTTVRQPIAEKVLSPRGPYPLVSLCKNGVCRLAYVHHLVAEAFLGPRPKGYQVCHEDGVPKHVQLNNLRYDTPTGNAKDRHRHGTHAIGEANPLNKYPEEMIANIKHDLLTVREFEVVRMWEIPRTTVAGIHQNRVWPHVQPAPMEPFPHIYIDDSDDIEGNTAS